MLRRHEIRILEGMERQLRSDDPSFVSKLTTERTRDRFRRWITPRRSLGLAVTTVAALCLLLGEGAAFFTTAALAAVLFLLNGWSVKTE
ncbi:DUF3040 domain-containing protein [Saccharopolyspora dendranthemae]|uniref:DUF3040 family protein n=1 Tax=Saccharopolyspora dendranthemae TaxID=1181886 RepID=A0A561U8B4_9PSEU|nr:DUF3040 domain-containing protein [Saccharopolyspora dendranthemae]TWF95595.1 DUF3040 family protein [Saccharopolyspora dendranthemae]